MPSNNYFTFNGIDSTVYGITCDPAVPILPERRRSTIEIPGRDGVYDFGINSYAPLIVSLNCLIKAGSRDARAAALAQAAIWLTGSGPLILSKNPTKRWTAAKLYGEVDLQLFGRNGFFPLSFECNPPYLEDVNATVGTIGTAQDYGSPVEFYPVITITKSGTTATSLQLSLLSTGEFVMISGASIASGDVIVVDMSTGKVTKNGALYMNRVSIDSLFFGVPPGSQTITVTTTSTYTASISYRKRYLYA